MNVDAEQGRKQSAIVEARRLAELARAAGLGDDPDAAVEWNRQAIDLLKTTGETPLLADVLRWQGSVFLQRGRTADAEPLYRRSLEVAESLAYDPGRAHGLNCLAVISQRRGDVRRATELFHAAAAVAERCHERRLLGMIQQNLGILADIRGERAAARTHYWSSLRVFESMGDTEAMTWVLNNLGLVDVSEGRHTEAERTYERALGLARERGDLLAEGVIEENRGELEILRGNLADACFSIDRALDIANQRRDPARRAAALKLRGIWEHRFSDPRVAVDTLRMALAEARATEDALLVGEILFELGEALAGSGDEIAGRDVWNTALAAFERIGAKAWVSRVQARLGVSDDGQQS
jgi:tetratricopeptide (TPR) repeat protein